MENDVDVQSLTLPPVQSPSFFESLSDRGVDERPVAETGVDHQSQVNTITSEVVADCHPNCHSFEDKDVQLLGKQPPTEDKQENHKGMPTELFSLFTRIYTYKFKM